MEGIDLSLPKVPSINLTSGGDATNPYLHPVCGTSTSYGRSPLQKAICEMDVATIQAELSTTSSSPPSIHSKAKTSSSIAANLREADEAGFCCLHLACAMYTEDAIPQPNSATNDSTPTKPVEVVRMLLAAGADVGILDSKGNTPLHWAARCGGKSIVALLLLKNSPRGE